MTPDAAPTAPPPAPAPAPARRDAFAVVKETFPQDVVREGKTVLYDGRVARGGTWLEVRPSNIRSILAFLKETDDLRFDYLSDIAGIDHLRLPGYGADQRFGVSYVLFSQERGEWVRIEALVPERDPEIASAVPLWTAADWLEREVYDMFGIRFTGHPDLRRILMPEDYVGYPLRKDYPLKGRGEREAFPRHEASYRPEAPDAAQGIYRGTPRRR